MSSKTSYSVCPHDCPSACALKINIDEGRLTRVKGDPEQPYTAGTICSKVGRYADRLYHKDRILKPLRRVGTKGSGRFEEISWEKALDEVAIKFIQAEHKYGAESVWPYSYAGTMGVLQRKSIQAFARSKGYSEQSGTICTRIGSSGWKAGLGAAISSNPLEIDNTDVLVLWGTNAAATQINVLTHFSRAKKSRGAKLVVIDPYLNETAKRADTYLAIKPGTDGALACAVMHVLLKENLADREFLEKHTDFDPELERHFVSRTPTWAASITGLSEDQIVDFAHMCAHAERTFIRVGIGLSRSRNGAVAMHALSCISSVLGHWNKTGSGALFTGPGNFNFDIGLITGAQHGSSTRKLDMCQLGPILNDDPTALKNGASVKAMIIQNANPAVVNPNLNVVHKGLMREDLFLCVHEQFMTDTALLADIVLPATMFLEHDDIYTSYGHQYLQAGAKQLEPQGECRSNHHVLSELAMRLDIDSSVFKMSTKQVLDETLLTSFEMTFDELTAKRFVDTTKGREGENIGGGFAWPDGRFRFKPDWKNAGPYHHGMPSMPDHWDVIDNTSNEYPLRLITPTAMGFLNTTFNANERSRQQAGKPHLKVNPNDIDNQIMTDGDDIIVKSKNGSLILSLSYDKGIPEGTVVAEGLWCGRDHKGGLGINVLTSDEPAAPNGGAVFHDTAVCINKI